MRLLRMKFMNSTLRAERLLFWALMATAVYGAVVFGYASFLKIGYPYLCNLGEPTLSQSIRFLSEGKNPYHDLSEPPYWVVPYGPVYPGFCALLLRWIPAPFVGGRLVAMVATIGAALLIYLWLRRNNTDRAFAVLTALIFICHPYTYRWGVQVNVDMAGLFMTLAVFYCLWSYILTDLKSQRFLVLGIFFGITAYFTKSSMLACSAAFFWFLVLEKRFKIAGIFLVSGVLGIGSIYFFLNQWTHGGYFFHTTFEISRREFFSAFIFRFWRAAVVTAPVFVAVSAWGLANLVPRFRSSKFGAGSREFGGAKFKSRSADPYLFLSLYLGFVLLLTISLGKQGSETNYLLEWCALSVLLLGVVLGRCSSARTKIVLYSVLICQIAFWLLPVYNLAHFKRSFDASREFFGHISALVRNTKGTVLSEDTSLVLTGGKEIFGEPFSMAQMSYSGVWDQTRILDELDRKRFSLVILYFYAPLLRANRNYTPAFLEHFKRSYHFVGVATPPHEAADIVNYRLFFYVPKKEE